jgi:hypothetical protein
MALSSEAEDILGTAVNGIPEIAQKIAAVPVEEWAGALEAAERVFQQTVKNLHWEEDAAEKWLSEVMHRLREEVEVQRLVSDVMTRFRSEVTEHGSTKKRSLQEELILAASELDKKADEP